MTMPWEWDWSPSNIINEVSKATNPSHLLNEAGRVIGEMSGGTLDILKGERARTDSFENRSYTADREDTSIQRRVSDAEKAGLSPLAVLGSGAGSSQASINSNSGPSIQENLLKQKQLGLTQAQLAGLYTENLIKGETYRNLVRENKLKAQNNYFEGQNPVVKTIEQVPDAIINTGKKLWNQVSSNPKWQKFLDENILTQQPVSTKGVSLKKQQKQKIGIYTQPTRPY